MQELVSRMETSLENATTTERPPKKYSSRHRLRKDMVGEHPILSLSVSGSGTGSATSFHCMICGRDVSMQSRGSREFVRHNSSVKHWLRDVALRVQQDLPVFDQLMRPLTLTADEKNAYLSRPRVEKDEGFNFLEDLLPKCARAGSSVPLMTTVICVAELCRCGGSYTLLKKFWDAFAQFWGLKTLYTAFTGIVGRLWLVTLAYYVVGILRFASWCFPSFSLVAL